MQFLIVIILAILIFLLIQRGLIQVDLSFPWLVSLIILGFLSINDKIVVSLASFFNLQFEPLSIVFLTIFILFGLTIMLLIGYTRLRNQHRSLLRKVISLELDKKKSKD